MSDRFRECGDEPSDVLVHDAVARCSRFCCGCGTPEHFWAVLKAVLEMAAAMPGQHPLYEWLQVDGEDVPERWFALYAIDGLGLLGHGGSIRGSWLEDDGRAVLAFLREYGVDWDDKPHMFFTSEDVVIGGKYT